VRARIAKVVLTVSLSAIVLLTSAGVSGADHWMWKFDGNDTKGSMDMKRVGLTIPGHNTRGDKGTVSCRGDFYEDLTPEQVIGFYCYYDTKGDKQFEYGILGYWNGSELTATASKFKNGAQVGSFSVPIYVKAGDVLIDIPKKKLHGRATYLNWRVASYSDRFDNAPDAASNYYKYTFPN
jgi:hypothetical protein